MAAVPIDPDELGRYLYATGKTDEAEAIFVRHLQANPGAAHTWNNLGIMRQQKRNPVSAAICYQNALKLKPGYGPALSNMGSLAEENGIFTDALIFYQRACEASPDNMAVWNNLASLYRELGRFDEAYAAHERAEALDPNPLVGVSTVYAHDCDPRTTARESLRFKREWWQRHRLPAQQWWPNERDPARRLRIGYVSGDFYCHSANFGFVNLLFGHGRRAFEVYAYSTTPRYDLVTERCSRSVDHWRRILGMSDQEIVDQIKRDQIDILVDLSGYTSGNRLRVFTAKPAPIQLHAIGYLNGTGLPEMDGILLDPVMGRQEEYVEQIVELPCAFNYRIPDAPEVAPLPALSNGYVTFGYLGRWGKVGPETLDLWREIMARLPSAKLLLKDRRLTNEIEQNAAAKSLNVDRRRLIFEAGTPHYPHLAAHGRVDIGLDPLVNNGGISTLDALWMGVPVITRPMGRASGHVGASIMTALGLKDFVASDYVETAVMAAGDTKSLADIRRTLRERMQGTTIGNPALHVAHVERAYRRLWADFCTYYMAEQIA